MLVDKKDCYLYNIKIHMGNSETTKALGTELKIGSRPGSGVIIVHKVADIIAAQLANGYSPDRSKSINTVSTVYNLYTRKPEKRVKRFDGVVTVEDLTKKSTS